jgi:hypothetical protein
MTMIHPRPQSLSIMFDKNNNDSPRPLSTLSFNHSIFNIFDKNNNDSSKAAIIFIQTLNWKSGMQCKYHIILQDKGIHTCFIEGRLISFLYMKWEQGAQNVFFVEAIFLTINRSLFLCFLPCSHISSHPHRASTGKS